MSRSETSLRQHWVIAVSAVLICILSLVLGYLASSLRIENGKDRPIDGKIEVYANNLIVRNEPLVEQAANDDTQIDKLIIERYIGQSHVRQLARGRIYYNLPLRDAATVKIYLHTVNPDKPKHDSRINALLGLERRGGAWSVTQEETIHVE